MKRRISWNKLDTYILKKFLSAFLLSLALLMTIVVVFDLSDNLNRFLSHDAPFREILVGRYFNFIPIFANLFTNLFTFIAVLWFTSKLSSHNEIISIYNGGISFRRLLQPYVAGALLIAVASFALSNFYIPQANERLDAFNREYLYLTREVTHSDMHIKIAGNTYVFMQHWRESEHTGENFTYEILGNKQVRYKLKAASVEFHEESNSWTLHHYLIRTLSDSGEETVRQGERLDTVFNFNHNEFNKTVKTAETMGYRALRKFIAEEKEKGSNLVKYYEIEKHKRVTTPFGVIIMALLGVSVASRKTQRGVGVHIFIGLALSFLFIFFQQVSNTFAISGNLSPLIASWLPNGVYAGICGFMLWRAGR